MTTLSILLIGLTIYIAYIYYVKSLKVDKVIEIKEGETKRITKEKGEFPASISKSYYMVKQWIFVFFMMIEGGVIMSAIQSLLRYSKVSFEGMFGVIFLTLVPAFGCLGSKSVRTIHLVGAATGFVLLVSMFWITFGHWYISVFALIVAAYTYFKHKESNLTFWIENNLILFVIFEGLLIETLIKMLSL